MGPNYRVTAPLTFVKQFDEIPFPRAYCAWEELGGAAEHLIDGSVKRICWLTFEFKSPHVIERRSKVNRKDRNNGKLCFQNLTLFSLAIAEKLLTKVSSFSDDVLYNLPSQVFSESFSTIIQPSTCAQFFRSRTQYLSRI